MVLSMTNEEHRSLLRTHMGVAYRCCRGSQAYGSGRAMAAEYVQEYVENALAIGWNSSTKDS